MPAFGVDEAGKGPVLGSMFAAAVIAEPSALPDDVGDSKGIAPGRREDLAAAIRDRGAVAVAEIPVERIDDEGTDMNSLTVAAHAEALEAVARDDDSGAGLSGYVDACDPNAVRFERRVADAVDAGLEVRAEHGADEEHPIVGAASVVAKVARDEHVADLAERYGEVGSGYPGDGTTREFLESYVADHGELPPCARSSWQTSADVLAAAGQASLEQFERDGGTVTGETAEVDGDRRGSRRPTLDDF